MTSSMEISPIEHPLRIINGYGLVTPAKFFDAVEVL
jgi:hypothetical protein